MRTLRSGKSLPDTPPVMRGSITAAINKLSSSSQTQNNITVVDNPTAAPNAISSETKQPDNVTSTPVTPQAITTCKGTRASNEEVIESESPSLLVERGRVRPPKISRFQPTATKVKENKAGAMFAGKSEPPPLPALRRRTLSLTMESKVKIEEDGNGVSDDITDPQNEAIKVDDDLRKEVDATTVKVDDTENVIQPQKVKIVPIKEEIENSPVAAPTTELRSLRCPRNQPVTVQATLAVERDSLPFLESCNICGEEFNRKSLLQRHYRIHKTPEPKEVEAEIKDDVSNLSSGPFEEQEGDYDQEHEDQKPAVIDFTKKRLSQSSMTIKDAITCNVCSRTFARQSHLNRHVLLHTGIKPFTCPVCNLSFTRKDHMLAHKTKHDKEHKIKCARCGMGFVTWQILQDHIKNVHSTFKPAVPVPGRSKAVSQNNNPENACDICGKKFLQRRYLRVHRKRHLRKDDSLSVQLRLLDQNQADRDDGEMYDEAEENLSHDVGSTSSSKLHIRRSLVSMNRIVKLAESSGFDAGSPDSSVMSFEGANLDKDELDDLMDYDYKAMMQLKSGSKRQGVSDKILKQIEQKYKDGIPSTSVEDFQSNTPGHAFAGTKADSSPLTIKSEPLDIEICCNEEFNPILTDDEMEQAQGQPLNNGELGEQLTGDGNDHFICNDCGKVFKNVKSLKRHKWYHSRGKPFICPICNRGFKYSADLGRHMKTHGNGDTKGTAPATFVPTTHHSAMNGHQDQAPPSYTNGTRGLRIRHVQQYRGRLITSLDTRQFGCKLCPQRFNHRSNLSRHVRLIHKTTNPRKRAHSKSSNQNLTVHQAMTPIKPIDQFICKECGSEYESQELLTKHILANSDSDAPCCILCGKLCNSPGLLKKHCQNFHPGYPNPAEIVSVHSENASNSNLKPTVIRTVRRDENGQEESDEEFPNESEDPPNMIKPGLVKPGSAPIVEVDVDNLDELVYAAVNPRHQVGRKIAEIPMSSKQAKLHCCPFAQCNRDFKVRADLQKHLRRHASELPHKCRICTARFPHKQDAHRHMKSIHNFACKSRVFPCDFCDQHFPAEIELENHMQTLHGVTLAEVFDEGNDEEYPEQDDYNNELDYEEAILDHHRSNAADPEDDEILDPTSFLEQSMGEASEKTDYHCGLCNKNFPTRQKWLYHRYYHVREEKYDCPNCDEKFQLRSHLERHIRTYHNDEKPVYNILTCDRCPRKFTREYDLTTHIQKVHLQIPPPSLIQKPRLSAPLPITMTMTKNRNPVSILKSSIISQPKPSSVASNQFPKVGALVRKSWPPMPPTKPTATIASSSVQSRPEPIESTMRLGPYGWYTCNLCGKSFKKSIDAHRYYHNREEKHLCTHCTGRFKQKSDLQRHIRIHHNSMNPKNTIHCPHCYRSFTDIRYMRMHIRRYHGENGSDNPQSYSRQGIIDFDEIEERHIMGEEVDDEMEWYTSPEEYLNEDDDDQKEMQTMEEMEYLQYKNETEFGGEMQLTISCECGVEVEAKDIADHLCSSLEEESSQEQGQEFLKLKGNKSTEYEPESQSLEPSPIPNDKQIESEGMAENSESTETVCKLSEAETVEHTSEPTIEDAQPPKQLAIDQDSSTEVVITDQQSTKNIEN